MDKVSHDGQMRCQAPREDRFRGLDLARGTDAGADLDFGVGHQVGRVII